MGALKYFRRPGESRPPHLQEKPRNSAGKKSKMETTILNTKKSAVQFLAYEMNDNGIVQQDCYMLIMGKEKIPGNRAKGDEIYKYENYLHTQKCRIYRMRNERGLQYCVEIEKEGQAYLTPEAIINKWTQEKEVKQLSLF